MPQQHPRAQDDRRIGQERHRPSKAQPVKEDLAQPWLVLLKGLRRLNPRAHWQPQSDPMPHHLVIDLGHEIVLTGITCIPRQDQTNDRIAEADVFLQH